MISIIDSGKLVNTDVSPMVPRSCEMVGLSTDTKPTGMSVGNGWSFIEMDTGKVFFYDAEDEEWLEFAGSGGGGQGGSNVLVVNATIVDEFTMSLDKTWKEIYDAPYAVVCMTTGENQKSFLNVSAIYEESGEYGVKAITPGQLDANAAVFTAASATGYPSISMGA